MIEYCHSTVFLQVDRHSCRLYGFWIIGTLSRMWRFSHIQVKINEKRIEIIDVVHFSYTSYRCTGDVTEWTKCSYSTRTPTRKRFEIPDDIKQEYDAL